AVVGFGSSFAGIPENGDGTYNCASAPNDDAKNACLWGSKDYGDGGFYYAENSEDIKNSIINFVNNVKVTFPPSSLGSISVPRDPLDQTRMMSTGFFPMILPQEATNVMTWAGNLKKYKVLGGTLKDSGNNAIYTTTNNQQVINSSAKDLWSIAATTDDHSSVKSGGAWNKIPVPSTLNIENEPSKSDSIRNVFTIDGTTLKKVTKANLATDYSGTDPAALSNTTNITVAQRYNLLNYLGYQASAGTTLTTSDVNGLATTPTSPYRYLGGVIHSTPLVVTQSATLNSDGNGVGSRKEYVVYGSMEGGLHVVDASNGEEQSVFVPKETLDNDSGKTLANWEFKTTGTMSYGVDAPWTADNTFKVKTTTSGTASTTKYEATKINIYGGLRMGGAALYGLNIKTPTSPSLLFRITPSTTGFSRMGQIWSKPTLADIRVKGVRKRVLIFGGGYDAAVYERNNATFTEPTTATQGNAIYIVDASNGTLLWMASSDTTGVADSYKKITSSEMLYSVVGQPVVRDYDADGLADMIYFADLGGQMFRVDLNNAAQTSTATNVNVGVRVKRIADLREGSGSNLFVPRFYDRLTTAIFGDGTNRFVLVSAGSGNRSFPLEASNTHNKVYGILDYDAAVKGIESTTYADANFKAVATSSNILARGILGKTSTTISSWGTNGSISDDKAVAEMGPSGAKRGWKFDLSSVGDNSTQKYSKSFEESQLVSNDLYVNVYDSQASLNGVASGCGGGVQGLSTTHRICAPYADCAAYVKQDYQGILGPIMGLTTENSRTSGLVGAVAANQEACVGHCPDNKTSLTNQNLYSYSQARKIKPTRWYER
ncbi:MAG: PilC/PilY family type IV pilus protein, partial [Acinetobacter sp.]